MNTVMSELKKRNAITKYKLNCDDIKVAILPVESAEIDEMWSFISKKKINVGYSMQ